MGVGNVTWLPVYFSCFTFGHASLLSIFNGLLVLCSYFLLGFLRKSKLFAACYVDLSIQTCSDWLFLLGGIRMVEIRLLRGSLCVLVLIWVAQSCLCILN